MTHITPKNNCNLQPPTVSFEDLLAAEREETYLHQLTQPDIFPSEKNWEYIIQNRMHSLAPALMHRYILAWMTPQSQRSDFHELVLDKMPEYLLALDRTRALDIVYADIQTSTQATINLIHRAKMFDATKLAMLLHDLKNLSFIINCLSAYQPVYTPSDLNSMQFLDEALSALPQTGHLRRTRNPFSNETRYECSNGHSNPADCEYCNTCGINIYGLTEHQTDKINNFKRRTIILATKLNNQDDK